MPWLSYFRYLQECMFLVEGEYENSCMSTPRGVLGVMSGEYKALMVSLLMLPTFVSHRVSTVSFGMPHGRPLLEQGPMV